LINIAGAARQSFAVPCDLAQAWRFFSLPENYLPLLPHIHLVKSFSPRRLRLMYSATEIGLYRVQIFCDLAIQADRRHNMLRIRPDPVRSQPGEPRPGWSGIVGHGDFVSTTTFHAAGRRTLIDYELSLAARLRKPALLSVIPDSVAEGVADPITAWRIKEIAREFTQRVIVYFARPAERSR
jgi:hypothetical protein